jgi:chromosomal replication initiation ATPase DnaA
MTDRPLINILTEVADRNGLSVVNMFARSRTTPIVNARHEYFFVAMNETTASSIQIGKACGKDHSAVLYGAVKHALKHQLPVPRGMSTRCFTRHSTGTLS